MRYRIETHRLSKAYGDFIAVNEINLHVPQGKVYGFLGPNGAGKSTTMKMLLGLIQPTGGSFTIGEKRYPEDRQQILRETGALIEAPCLLWQLDR